MTSHNVMRLYPGTQTLDWYRFLRVACQMLKIVISRANQQRGVAGYD